MDASVIPSTEGVSHIGHRQRMSTIYRTNEIIRRIQGEGQSAEISAANTKKAVRLSSLYNCGVGKAHLNHYYSRVSSYMY